VGVLALKLLLAPGFVVATSVVARRHGALVGGLVGGLPVVAGPILVVLAIVHGRDFGAHAAASALLGMISLASFVVLYARLAPHVSWLVALPAGWLAFAGSTAVLSATHEPRPLIGLAACCATFALGLAIVRPLPAGDGSFAPPAWDLPLRALTAAVMVVAITAISSSLGAELSGLVAPFPVITSVLAAFTHAQRGAADTVRMLRGMLAGFSVYALLVLAFALALGAPA
jgi:hypothetical protein